ncbi:hypothetical protein EMPG_13060, partial [Blastomyces silverae]
MYTFGGPRTQPRRRPQSRPQLWDRRAKRTHKTSQQIPHNDAGNDLFSSSNVQLAQHPGSVATRRTKPTGKMAFTKLVKNSAYY